MTRVFIWKNNSPQEWEEISTSSFEAWYQKQTHYVKISERSNENGIYREA